MVYNFNGIIISAEKVGNCILLSDLDGERKKYYPSDHSISDKDFIEYLFFYDYCYTYRQFIEQFYKQEENTNENCKVPC